MYESILPISDKTWLNEFYKFMNRLMRIHKIDNYSKCIISEMINYIHQNGISANELQTKYKYLYRSIPNNILIKKLIQDDGFISMTPDRNIAKEYGTKIIVINTSDLQFDFKYLVLQDTVYLLPGYFTIKYLHTNNDLEYTYISKQLHFDENMPKILKMPNISLENSIIILYRAIPNRSIEIIGHSFSICDFDLYDSNYHYFMAIYNYKEDKIVTMSYGIFDEMFNNLFDQSQLQETKTIILETFSYLLNPELFSENSFSSE
jgi:hypothetical protein